MTLKDLREIVDRTPTAYDPHHVKVWLPGSHISLGPMGPGMLVREINGVTTLLIEGNVDPGSALRRD